MKGPEQFRGERLAAFTYIQGALVLLPTLAVFWAVSTFIVPKLKQMCADTGYDPRNVFAILDFSRENGVWIAFATVVVVGLAEKLSLFWARRRKVLVWTLVFVANFTVLLALTALLFVAAVVGPALHRL